MSDYCQKSSGKGVVQMRWAGNNMCCQPKHPKYCTLKKSVLENKKISALPINTTTSKHRFARNGGLKWWCLSEAPDFLVVSLLIPFLYNTFDMLLRAHIIPAHLIWRQIRATSFSITTHHSNGPFGPQSGFMGLIIMLIKVITMMTSKTGLCAPRQMTYLWW